MPKYEWKLEGESKKIGNYTCFKATAVVKVSESDFRNFRFRNNNPKEGEKKAETVKDTAKAKKTNSQMIGKCLKKMSLQHGIAQKFL